MTFVIDGLDGIEGCYHFAGFCGVAPNGLTLRQLWQMACGKLRQSRFANVELASLVWSMGEIDIERYLYYGHLQTTGKGGPVRLTPDQELAVAEEVERIRRENPGLPQFGGGR